MKNALIFSALLLLPSCVAAQRLLVANQGDHTLLIIDPVSRQTLAKVGVDINGHEVIASPDGKFAYVPIYGNSGIGKPGTDGSTVEVIEIASGRAIDIIDLGKPVPGAASFAVFAKGAGVLFPIYSNRETEQYYLH